MTIGLEKGFSAYLSPEIRFVGLRQR